jgi:hypothetical protein
VFVKKYAKYLEEKVSVVRNLGFEFEKNKNILKETKIPKAFRIIGKLQSQLNALLNCRVYIFPLFTSIVIAYETRKHFPLSLLFS